MRRRKNRFGDITVHNKAYMGGILYGKKPVKAQHPAAALQAVRSLGQFLAAPFLFVLGSIAHLASHAWGWWMLVTKRVPPQPKFKSVYVLPPDTGNVPLLSEPKPARRWFAVAAALSVLALSALAVRYWPTGQQAFSLDSQALGVYVAGAALPEARESAQEAVPQADGDMLLARARPVIIHAGDEIHFIAMQQGTVKDALELANLDCDMDDEVTPMLHEQVEAGLRIVYNEVEVRYETEVKAIPFKTIKRNDATMEKGQTRVRNEGKEGQKSVLLRIETVNGEETEREEVSQQVITHPVDKVVLNGSKTAEKPKSVTVSAYGLRNDNRPRRDPPKPEEIAQTVQVQATAYTHTGRRTATGTRPKVGTIAVNPKQIPYGTLLYIEGYGYGRAEDTGAFRHTDRFQIDLFMDTVRECLKWGRKNNVTVYILK